MSAAAANPAYGDAFAALDRNHDGVLSRQEFYGAMQGQFGGVPAEPVAVGAAPAMTMAAPQVVSYAQPGTAYPPMTAPPVYMQSGAAPPQFLPQGQPQMSYMPPTTVTAPPVYMSAPPQPQAVPPTMYDRQFEGAVHQQEFHGMPGSAHAPVAQAPPMMSYGPPTTVTAPPVYLTSPAAMPAASVASGAFMQEPVAAQPQPQPFQVQPQPMGGSLTAAPQIVSYGAPPPMPQQPQAMPSFAPPTTVTAPPVYVNAQHFMTAPGAAPAAQPGMFDMLDRNHDGVLSREEFAAAVAASAPAAGGSATAPQVVSYGAPQVTTAAPVYLTQPAQIMSAAPAASGFMQEPVAMGQQPPMFAEQRAYAAPQVASYVPPPQPAQPQVSVSYLPPTTVQAPPVYITMPAAAPAAAVGSYLSQPAFEQQEFAQRGDSANVPPQVVSYPQAMPADPNAPVRMLPPIYMTAPAQHMHSFQPPPAAAGQPIYMQGPPMQEPAVGAPQVISYGAPPMTMAAQPMTMAAPPAMMAAPPTIYQAPQTVGAGFPMEPVAGGAPMMYQAPPTVMHYQQHQQPQQGDIFSALDRNHDGVLSREEFAAAAGVGR